MSRVFGGLGNASVASDRLSGSWSAFASSVTFDELSGGVSRPGDAIVLTPDETGETPQIELRGNLAMLGATVQSKRSSETDDLSLRVSLVAGRASMLEDNARGMRQVPALGASGSD